jgi:hypothetical protein
MTEKKMKTVGSYAEIWHNHALHSSGGLKKKDLMKHKGRIISRKKHAAGKKAIKHLFKLGYKPKKGTFKLMRKSDSRKKTMKKGGAYGTVEAPVNVKSYSGSVSMPTAKGM